MFVFYRKKSAFWWTGDWRLVKKRIPNIGMHISVLWFSCFNDFFVDFFYFFLFLFFVFCKPAYSARGKSVAVAFAISGMLQVTGDTQIVLFVSTGPGVLDH